MSIVDIKYVAIGNGEMPMKLVPKPKYVDDDDVNSDDDDDDDAGSYNDDDVDVDEVEGGIKKKTVLQKVIPSKKIGKSVRNDDDDDDDEVDEDDDADDDDESYYSDNDSAKNDEDDGDDDDDDAGMKHAKQKQADGGEDSDDNPASDDTDGDGSVAVDDDDDEGDDGQDGEKYKKINFEFRKNYITETHPEAESHTDDEIHALAKVVRNKVGIIVDPLHKTIPLLTKYEKTRILGIRTKQLNNGATPYVSSKTGLGSGSGQGQVIDGYTIALRELDEKKLPFIIRRPLPNGGTEYWYLQDLEVL
jgi:DNA-directed RNA polymerase subunit K/omega